MSVNEHDVEEMLSALIDDELSAADRARVEGHLRGCARCRGELASLREVRGRLRVARPHTLPDAVLDRNEFWLAGLTPAPARSQLRWLAPSALVFAAAAAALWLRSGPRGDAARRPIPIEPLLAAHFRYSVDASAEGGNLIAANYSDGWAFNEATGNR